MPDTPKTWNMKGVSQWWQRGIEKERIRNTNAPKPHKGDKTSVPVNFSDFAPPMAKKSHPVWTGWKER